MYVNKANIFTLPIETILCICGEINKCFLFITQAFKIISRKNLTHLFIN